MELKWNIFTFLETENLQCVTFADPKADTETQEIYYKSVQGWGDNEGRVQAKRVQWWEAEAGWERGAGVGIVDARSGWSGKQVAEAGSG